MTVCRVGVSELRARPVHVLPIDGHAVDRRSPANLLLITGHDVVSVAVVEEVPDSYMRPHTSSVIDRLPGPCLGPHVGKSRTAEDVDTHETRGVVVGPCR